MEEEELGLSPSGSSFDGARKEQEEDHISALPDDALVLILLRLGSVLAAGRTSVLSKRWRRVWKLLPKLSFWDDADPRRIRAAISAHEADLHLLFVSVGPVGAAHEYVAACLRVAAPRLSGLLTFHIEPPAPGGNANAEQQQSGAFELPCFHRATHLTLNLGFLGLAVPPAGDFARLTKLTLQCVRFYGPCELGDAVSSPRCPHLVTLLVVNVRGLRNLAIHSESLSLLCLNDLRGLQKLALVAPALRQLVFRGHSALRKLTADISAPQLESLDWDHQRCAPFGQMTQLQTLIPVDVHAYCQRPRRNRSAVKLLGQIRSTRELRMTLKFPHDIGYFQYLMERITTLPRLVGLDLSIFSNGHSYGASAFHLLRMCNDLKVLELDLVTCPTVMEVQSTCPPGCICGEPSGWRTEELTLNSLQEVNIFGMKGADHEVIFLKRLFSLATALKTMSITFDCSITESKAMELCQKFSSFSRPETLMKFYMSRYTWKGPRYPLSPDQDHGV